jgi:hypothetical protein
VAPVNAQCNILRSQGAGVALRHKQTAERNGVRGRDFIARCVIAARRQDPARLNFAARRRPHTVSDDCIAV